MWRPHEKIRVIAIALIYHNGRLLVEAVHNDDRSIKGWRPPGGGMEFGETAEQTLGREFMEEFGAAINVGKRIAVIENHFAHGGKRGHEIVFVHDAKLREDTLTKREEFMFNENGDPALARWVKVEDFTSGAETLFPAGLIDWIITQR
jgi:ADP-ribose pyrophosphatase YjhB (NUDIX family)